MSRSSELSARVTSLESLGMVFNEFLGEVVEMFEDVFAKKRAETEEGMAAILMFYIYFGFLADHGILDNLHPTERMIVAKTASNILAVKTLLESGCPSEAAVVLRSILESLITITYINRNFEEFADLFYNHREFEAFHRFELQKKYDGVIDEEQPSYIETVLRYEKIKDNYKKDRPWYFKALKQELDEISTRDGTEKRNPSIKSMADLSGLLEEYDYVYSMLSIPSHGSSLTERFLLRDDGHLAVAPTYSKNHYNLAMLSVGYAHKILTRILGRNESPFNKLLCDMSTMLAHAMTE